MSKWKDAYNRYRQLEFKWQQYGVPVYDLVFTSPPDERVRNYWDAGLQVPDKRMEEILTTKVPDKAIKEILQIRPVVREAIKGKTLFEDVYHAALFMIDHPAYWAADPKARNVYRGQRCRWPIRPKLFRNNPTQNEIDSELNRLASLSEALKHRYLQSNEYQRIAIAQHYSKEACVKTWVVDLTRNPWVALFFASKASKDGRRRDIGHVICFSRKGWEDFSAGGKNRLGDIKLIDIPEVPRIEAQKATFLDGSHPDLIEQYFAVQIEFLQHNNRIFEDPLIGITKEKLLPQNDALLDFIAKWKASPQEPTQRLIVKPANDALRPLQYSDYLDIVMSWAEWWKAPLSQQRKNILKKMCDFHARLQEKRKDINLEARSLRRLRGALNSTLVCKQSKLNLRWVVDQYLRRASKSARPVIYRVLSEIEDNNSY